MRIIYPFMKVINGEKNPNLKELDKMNPKNAMRYLMEPGNMKGKYLGACLDSCRWGSPITVKWETDVKGLMSLIQKWRKENNDDLDLYHEIPVNEMYSKFELPHINYKNCPRDKDHKKTFTDLSLQVRCGERSVQSFKPSFIKSYISFDELSQMSIENYHEEKPCNPSYEDDYGKISCDEDEWNKYLEESHKYKTENQSEEIIDVCHAIISDKNVVLPFETILDRLNLAQKTKTFFCRTKDSYSCKRLDEVDILDRDDYRYHCRGHTEPNKEVVFPFDGWDLAYYLQRWREQVPNGNAPWFSFKKEKWTPKPIPCCD